MPKSRIADLPYRRKARRLANQAAIHDARADDLFRKAKAERALAKSLRKASQLACPLGIPLDSLSEDQMGFLYEAHRG